MVNLKEFQPKELLFYAFVNSLLKYVYPIVAINNISKLASRLIR